VFVRINKHAQPISNTTRPEIASYFKVEARPHNQKIPLRNRPIFCRIKQKF